MANEQIIANLIVKLSAQTVELQKGLQQAESKIETFAKGVTKVLGGLTAAAALYKLQGAIMGVVDRAADLSRLSEKIGIPMQEFAKFAVAAQDIGISSETMGRGVKFLSRNMQEATQGGGEAKEIFNALNVTFENSPGFLKPTAEVILSLADTFSVMDDSATKTALAVKLFGRGGIEMIPFLNQGREAIEKMIASNVRMGAAMDSDLGQKARKFKLTLNEIKDASDGLTIAFTAALLPTLQKLAKLLQDVAEDANGVRTALQGIVDFIESGIILAGITLFVKFAAAITGAIIAAGGLGAALSGALEALSLILMANPQIAGIMLVAAALYSVYLVWKSIPPEVDKAAESHKKFTAEIKKMKPEEQKQKIDVYTQAVADMRHEIQTLQTTMESQKSFGDLIGVEDTKKKLDELNVKFEETRYYLGLLKTTAAKGIEAPLIADPGVVDTLKKKMIELKASFADFGPPVAKSRAAFKATLDAIVEGKGPIKLYQEQIDALIKKHNEYIATETRMKVYAANIAGDLSKAESYWESYLNDLEIDYSVGLVDLSDYFEERKRVLVEKTAAEIEALKKERAIKTTTEERKVAIDVEIQVKGEKLDAALKKETDAGKKAVEALKAAVRAGDLQAVIDQNSLDLITIEGQFADGLLAIQDFYDKRRAIIQAEANKEIANIEASIVPGMDPVALQKAQDQIKAIRARAGLDIAKADRAQLEDTRANYKQMLDVGMTYAQQKADLAWGEIGTLQATQDMEMRQREQKDQEELAQLRAVKGETIIIEGQAVDKLEAERDMIGVQTMRKKKLLVDQETQLELKKYELAAGVAKGTGDLFGELYEMSGKKVKAFFYMQKAAAVAEAIINVAAGVTAALKLGPIIGPVMAGIVTAMGAVQIAKIMSSTIKGAEKGGPIREGSGTKDDVLIRVMKGEFIQPKGVVQYYGMNFMEALRRKLIPRDAFSGSIRGKAKGGPITEGSGEKDDVLIKVMRGEYVQTKEAVAYYGLNVMEAIRRRLIPRDAFRDVPFFPVMMPQMAFATGGAVAGNGITGAGSSEVSNSVTVPLTVYGGDKSLASRLRVNIEEVVIKTLREHTR